MNLLLTAFVLAALAAPPPPGGAQSHRNLGKAHYERADYTLAVREFLKVLETEHGRARDHFNAGMALLQNGEYDRALSALTTARQIDPGFVDADFGLGVLYAREMRNPAALQAFRRVATADPADPCAWFNVGAVAFNLAQWDEARLAFDRVLAMGYAAARNFYVAALFRQATLLQRQGRRDEAGKLFAEFQTRREQVPNVSLTSTALENGRHGRIEITPERPASSPAPPTAPPEFRLIGAGRVAERPCTAPAGAGPRVALADVDGDGLVDLFVTNPCGPSRLFHNGGGGRLVDVTARVGLGDSKDGLGALFIDHVNGGWPSLLVLHRDANRFYRNVKGSFSDASPASGLGREGAAPGATALGLDFDNDGQLDVFIAGAAAAGPRLYRNNGDGSFRNVSLPAGLPDARAAAFADFDNDGFADLLLAPPNGAPLLLRNLGDGRFDARTVPGVPRPGADAVASLAVADFDGDGWFDALVSSSRGWAALRNTGGRLEALRDSPAVSLHPDGTALLLDASGDGGEEVLARDDAGRARSWSYRGGGRFEEAQVRMPVSLSGLAAAADLDGRGSLDLVDLASDGRLRLYRRAARGGGAWIALRVKGEKSNRQGVGAVVEVKAGDFYRKELARGLPLLISTGGRKRVDVVRITWTNGVIQNELGVAAGRRVDVKETDRQTSSCPFVYAWDGERFRFLTDVVGRAPLGEVGPDGRPAPLNPEDYVRIPPGFMRPRDGRYVFQVTEELRETAYLDAVELVAVDRPAGGALYVDEKYPGDLAAPLAIHRVTAEHPPLGATNDRGEDLRPLLAAADGRTVADFTRGPIAGLAEPHALILDPGEVGSSGPLRLFLTGWVYWINSSGMRALSGRPDLAPEPPSLQVKDEARRWVTVIDDIGIPSGINRTIAVDLTGKFRSEDHRVRIPSNLAVYWDRAFFATDEASAAPTLRPLRPAEADLHHRGFSLPVLDPGGSRPDSFDYAHLLESSPWNAAAGLYTRAGDVGGLVRAVDDRIVVMAPGDELTLTFDPSTLPRLPEGWTRDFMLRFAGWAKDNEPATLAAGAVEPLPFHAMASYPPPPGQGLTPGDAGEGNLDRSRTRRIYRFVPDLAPLVVP
jgi:hypothetical protein